MTTSWCPARRVQQVSNKDLQDLFDNRFSFLVVESFVSSKDSDQILNFLKSKDVIKPYQYEHDSDVTPEALHYMTTHYLFEQDTNASGYLEAARESRDQYIELAKGSGVDVLQMIQEQFTTAGLNLSCASEDGEKYSQCIVRSLFDGALLHADFANFIPDHWSVHHIDAELAWNVFLTVPEQGGECVVYNRQWERQDDRYVIEDTYGYDQTVVDGCDRAKFRPTQGAFVLFNSRNFHTVLPSKGEVDRITMGGHIGRVRGEDDSLISWV